MDGLRDYHDRMGALVRQIETRLREGPCAADALTRMRGEMARLLTAYQLHVHRELYAPLLAGSPPLLDPRRIRAIKAECIAIGEEFRAYRDHWAKRDVAADWLDYQPAAQGFMARIRRHIEDVERILVEVETSSSIAA